MDTTFPDDPLSIFGSQNENSSYTEKKIKKMQKCKKCNKICNSVKNLQRHKLIHAEVKPYSCSYCTMKFSRKDLDEKHMSLKHKYRAKDFCEICKKEVASKYYLKIHMLRKHQIEIVSNRKNRTKEQTEMIQVGKYQLTKHEAVNRTKDIHQDSIEEIVPFVYNSETKQCIPKYEEIKVFIGANSWKKEDGRKWNGREKKENIEIQKVKRLKIDRKDLPLLPPPNPSEMITKRHIFDYIHSLKITPGNYTKLNYQKYVFETVLSFKKLAIDKLSEFSVKLLESKATSFTCGIYGKWRKCSGHRYKIYRQFANNMRDPFDWFPELVHEDKKENIEIPKPKVQKSDNKYVPLILPSYSSELLTKRQIFDDIYSRKITPGQCKNFVYIKHILETVLNLKKVTIDELTESSIKKLKTKVNGLTSDIYTKWKKSGIRLYRRFHNNMEDPFDWIPELLHQENKEKNKMPKPEIKKSEKKDGRWILPPSNSSKLLSRRQIFDDIYSRKITPGQCSKSDYEKHVLETVLNLKKVTIDKLSESSVKKLTTKVNSFTSVVYTLWKKHGLYRIYRTFQTTAHFDWIPELKEKCEENNSIHA